MRKIEIKNRPGYRLQRSKANPRVRRWVKERQPQGKASVAALELVNWSDEDALAPGGYLHRPDAGGGHPPDMWFHGTTKEFDWFADPAEVPSPSGHWNALIGPHFADDPRVAGSFTRALYSKGLEGMHGEAPRILPVRLAIRRPAFFSDEKDLDALAQALLLERGYLDPGELAEHMAGHYEDNLGFLEEAPMREVLSRLRDEGIPMLKLAEARYDRSDFIEDDEDPDAPPQWRHSQLYLEAADQVRRHLQRHGRDGILYRNELEGGLGAVPLGLPQIEPYFAKRSYSLAELDAELRSFAFKGRSGYVLKPSEKDPRKRRWQRVGQPAGAKRGKASLEVTPAERELLARMGLPEAPLRSAALQQFVGNPRYLLGRATLQGDLAEVPIGTPLPEGWLSLPKPRPWSRQRHYNPAVAVAQEDPDLPGVYVVRLRPDAPHRTYELGIPQDGSLYRGIGFEEMEYIRRNRHVRSKGEYNVGDREQGGTLFTLDPEQAAYYAGPFQPLPFRVTPTTPGYVLKVNPSGLAVEDGESPGKEHLERIVRGEVPLSSIEGVWAVEPFEVSDGSLTLIRQYSWPDGGEVWQGGSYSLPDAQYAYRQLGEGEVRELLGSRIRVRGEAGEPQEPRPATGKADLAMGEVLDINDIRRTGGKKRGITRSFVGTDAQGREVYVKYPDPAGAYGKLTNPYYGNPIDPELLKYRMERGYHAEVGSSILGQLMGVPVVKYGLLTDGRLDPDYDEPIAVGTVSELVPGAKAAGEIYRGYPGTNPADVYYALRTGRSRLPWDERYLERFQDHSGLGKDLLEYQVGQQLAFAALVDDKDRHGMNTLVAPEQGILSVDLLRSYPQHIDWSGKLLAYRFGNDGVSFNSQSPMEYAPEQRKGLEPMYTFAPVETYDRLKLVEELGKLKLPANVRAGLEDTRDAFEALPDWGEIAYNYHKTNKWARPDGAF